MEKKCLITGATSGIGEALAHLIAKEGYTLILVGRNAGQLAAIAADLPTSTIPIQADLSRDSDRNTVVETIKSHAPELVINNAGIGLYGTLLDHDTSEQLALVDLNVKALTQLTIEAAKALANAKKTGTILNVSSVAGYVERFPLFATYCASKAYVTHFSQSADADLAEKGIRVLVSCPGKVKTRFQERASKGEKHSAGGWDVMEPHYAAQRMWKQIQTGKKVDVFDWKYQIASFLTKYLIPNILQEKALRNKI